MNTNAMEKQKSVNSQYSTPPKRGLSISQFLHLRRICHSTEDFKKKTVDMTRRFSQRGYPASWIDHACELALKKTRSDLLKKTIKKKKKFSVTCINQHSTHSNAIWSMFRKHWHILKSDSELGGKNMRDHLVRAIFNQEEKSSQETQTCLLPLSKGNSRCRSCVQHNSTMKTNHFSHK